MLFREWPFFTVKNLVTLIFLGLTGLSVAEASPSGGVYQCRNVLRLLSASQIGNTITALAKMKLELDEALVRGGQQTLEQVLTPQFSIKENEATRLLQDSGAMSKAEVTAALKKEIARLQQGKNKISERRVQSTAEIKELLDLDYYRQQMIFNELPAGSVQYNGGKISVEKFAMLATPVTQKMWAIILAEAGKTDLKMLTPSSKPFTGKLKIKDLELEMNPDHPVDRFDGSMMNQFLIALNTLSISSDSQVQAKLKELIPDHQEYDIYDLPTNQQWEYVRTNMGTMYKNFFDRDDGSEVSLYAWVFSDDALDIKPVALLQPRVINGKPFYDLEGNSLEYTKTTMPDKSNVVRGMTQISQSTSMPISSAFPGVGFRLIRLRR